MKVQGGSTETLKQRIRMACFTFWLITFPYAFGILGVIIIHSSAIIGIGVSLIYLLLSFCIFYFRMAPSPFWQKFFIGILHVVCYFFIFGYFLATYFDWEAPMEEIASTRQEEIVFWLSALGLYFLSYGIRTRRFIAWVVYFLLVSFFTIARLVDSEIWVVLIPFVPLAILVANFRLFIPNKKPQVSASAV